MEFIETFFFSDSSYKYSCLFVLIKVDASECPLGYLLYCGGKKKKTLLPVKSRKIFKMLLYSLILCHSGKSASKTLLCLKDPVNSGLNFLRWLFH